MKLKADEPYIIAHRGASALAPENTIAAFRKAIGDGAEGIEFDVRLARDGVPVVIHDASLKRVGARAGLIAQYTSEELGKIDVGSWYNRFKPERADEVFATETVSTLESVLFFLRDYKGLIYVEIKCRKAEIERISKAVCEIISRSPRLLPQIIVKSFRLETIPIIKSFCPEAQTAALFAPKILTILRKEKRIAELAHEIGADQISVHFSLATRNLMKKAGERNLPVTIWTADNPLWARRAGELGIRAIITNNPARLLAIKAKFSEVKNKN
jgi:glycerophosphoryl diester phosphodiesterase